MATAGCSRWPRWPQALLGSVWGTEPQGRRPEPGFPLLSARCCRGGQEGEIFTVTNPSLCSGMGTPGLCCLPVPGALCEPQTALKMLLAAGAQCQGCFSAHLPTLPASSRLLQGLSAAPVPSKQERDHRVPSARLQSSQSSLCKALPPAQSCPAFHRLTFFPQRSHL